MQIAVKILSFRYPNAERKALDNISFKLPEGSFTTLCGTSGCGKSTLLRMLKPCLQPHGEMSGEIIPELSEQQSAQDIGLLCRTPRRRFAPTECGMSSRSHWKASASSPTECAAI